MTYKMERPTGRTVGRIPGSADSDSHQGAQGELELAYRTTPRALTAPSKIRRVLSALATGDSYNRFQAARELHDHCLHSTVAEIQSRFGIAVYRETESIPGFEGIPTKCCRYSLTPAMRAKAREILERGLR